jgi:hypothetical protein
MRVFFVALLIALLPVRGWVGDAMAISMASLPGGEHTAMAMADSDGAHDHHAGMDDVATDPAAHVATDAAADADTHSHSACDVCNGPVLTVADTSPDLARAVHALRADRVEAFVSSVPRAGHKPPIS